MSLTAALTTATRSLDIFSLGIQVAGHNIANASTPGYVREELTTTTNPPYQWGNLVLGTGATVSSIRQQLDDYLEQRIRTANTDYAAANQRYDAYLQLQTMLGELGDQDLSTRLNQFLESIQNVVNQPDDAALRTQVIQRGGQLATDALQLHQRIEELRATSSDNIRSLVEEANTLIRSIAQLNPQIARLEANGLAPNEAGSLRIQRLNALQRLSEIIPLRVQENSSGSVDLFTGSDYLLLGGSYQLLETVVEPNEAGEAQLNVQLSRTHSLLGAGGGELGGLIEGRDAVLGGFLNQLDQLIGSVIFEFNKLHSSGEGLRGYTSVTGAYAVADTTAALNAAGLEFMPGHGSFLLKVRNQSTGAIEVSNLAIDLDGIGADTSLEDLRAALDAIDRVTAEITADGRLKLTADGGYELRFGNDTSGVLAALGINTFFTGTNSGNIAVNPLLRQDQRYLATGRGGGPADNANAIALAAFLDNPVAALGGLSLEDFHTALIGSVAQSAAAEEALTSGFERFRDALNTQREQRSGVSLDEEAVRIMQLQRNYQAAARIVATIDELLNTLLNV